MTLDRKLICLLISCLCFGVSGCMGWFEGTEVVLAHALSKGDSEHIAKWTLEEARGWQIGEGLSALDYRVVQARDDPKKAEEAIRWYLFVVEKIEDWPPDRIIASQSGVDLTTRQLIRSVYNMATEGAFHDYASSKELLSRLRPDEKHALWLRMWQDAVDRLQKEREQGEENRKVNQSAAQ